MGVCKPRNVIFISFISTVLSPHKQVAQDIASGENSSQIQGSIPANTQLQTSLRVVSGDENTPAYVELAVQTINDTVVRSVIIFAEGVFY